MTDPTAAIQKVATLVERRYNPRGNVHLPWWQSKTVSNSKLTQESAGDLARAMHAQRAGTYHDGGSGFWSYKGNTLAEEAFADFPHREIVARSPLGHEGYSLSAAADGVIQVDGYVFVGEHKAFGEPNWDKMDQALRQGANHLAMMWESVVAAGKDQTFPIAPWGKPTGNTPFTFLSSYRPGGVLRAVAPNSPPAIITPLVMTEEELAQILAFFKAKALAVLRSALSGDFTESDAWDRDHPEEFTRSIETLVDPPAALHEVLPKYEAAKSAESVAKREKKRLAAEILKAMDTAGLMKTVAGGIEVKVTEKKGRRTADVKRLLADGLTEYVRDGKPYPEIRTRDPAGRESSDASDEEEET